VWRSRFYAMLRRAVSLNPAVASVSLARAAIELCCQVLRLLLLSPISPPKLGAAAPAAALASLALLIAQPTAVEDLVRPRR
jgi:hypothetical protein